jgi:hypothetical protein
MSQKTTTAQLLARPIQYLVESTEGEQPTGSAVVLGAVEALSINKDGRYIEVGQLGPEDLISLIKGLEIFETQMTLNPIDGAIIARATNPANYASPSGTVSETLSIFIAIYLNGVINYISLLGSRIRDVTYTREKGKDDKVTINWKHTDITLPSATPPTGVTLSTTWPTGTVWNHLTGGANPLSVNGVGVLLTKFSITVNRNTTEDHTVGNSKPYGTQPHGRRIGGDYTILWTNTDNETLYQNVTAHTVALVLNSSGPITLTATGCKVATHKKDLDQSSDEAITEVATFKALGVSVA